MNIVVCHKHQHHPLHFIEKNKDNQISRGTQIQVSKHLTPTDTHTRNKHPNGAEMSQLHTADERKFTSTSIWHMQWSKLWLNSTHARFGPSSTADQKEQRKCKCAFYSSLVHKNAQYLKRVCVINRFQASDDRKVLVCGTLSPFHFQFLKRRGSTSVIIEQWLYMGSTLTDTWTVGDW